MTKLSPEAKVGLLAFAGLALLAYMSIRISGFSLTGEQNGYSLQVYFASAAGLTKDAAVEIAGVEVGRVKGIALDNGKARVSLLIRRGVELREDVQAIIRTKGVLGDKYIEIVSGGDSAPFLQNEGTIKRTVTAADIDKLLHQLSDVGGNVTHVTESLADSIGTEEGKKAIQSILKNLRDITIALNDTIRKNDKNVNRMLENFTQLSEDMKTITSTNTEYLNNIIANVNVTTSYLRESMSSFNDVMAQMGKGEGTIGHLVYDNEPFERLSEALKALEAISKKINTEGAADRLNNSLGSLEGITRKINQGQGTIGQLVNNDDTVRNLNSTMTKINDYLEKQERFKTSVDYHGEYMVDDKEVKSYVSLKIQPKEDKYYEVGIVDDPGGTTTITTTKRTVNDVTTTEKEEKIDQKAIKFSAQIAKRYYDLALRGGLIESTGGFGIDYYFFNDRFISSFDAFDFDAEKNFHLKFKTEFVPVQHLYIAAGVDDFISENDEASLFFGAGIRFSDDDLKTLLSNVQVSPAK
ncbi:MAG: MlaD family protein [Pseudomonadota bacterium]